MAGIVIKSENISKQYRLGLVGTGTLSHDLNRLWHSIRGKEDPYLKVGEANDRSKAGNSDYVWALRDVNFELKQGEVLGIIGKNGAGKSTLLKILSRVTQPTTGSIKAKGRIAALLEVGTGFHPELSGRENIFLNGAILGMTKVEIRKKFDEIVDFSGVERYIDTPVKRYSSGMYVRLAFAVAAHLDPEILIVDEVLAVGDAEFQKKCLGKMKDVSGQGRTILFVSHNMSAVQSLCTRAIMLRDGTIVMDGETTTVLENYFYIKNEVKSNPIQEIPADWIRPWGRKNARLLKVEMFNSKGKSTVNLLFEEKFKLRISFEVETPLPGSMIQVRISKPDGTQISRSDSKVDNGILYDLQVGIHTIEVEMTPYLMPGNYNFFLYINNYDASVFYDAITNFFDFNVAQKNCKNEIEPTIPANSSINFYVPSKWTLQK